MKVRWFLFMFNDLVIFQKKLLLMVVLCLVLKRECGLVLLMSIKSKGWVYVCFDWLLSCVIFPLLYNKSKVYDYS